MKTIKKLATLVVLIGILFVFQQCTTQDENIEVDETDNTLSRVGSSRTLYSYIVTYPSGTTQAQRSAFAQPYVNETGEYGISEINSLVEYWLVYDNFCFDCENRGPCPTCIKIESSGGDPLDDIDIFVLSNERIPISHSGF